LLPKRQDYSALADYLFYQTSRILGWRNRAKLCNIFLAQELRRNKLLLTNGWHLARDLLSPLAGSNTFRRRTAMNVATVPIKTPSLLITDDDPGYRATLEVIFRPKGFRTLLAGDGEEALAIVRREQVHLVLLDFHMPKLSGLETLRRLKEYHSLLPCILLSAHLDETLIDQARHAQAFSILPKSAPIPQLISTVQQALQRAYAWKA